MSDAQQREDEQPIRQALATGDLQLAAQLTFERHASDVLSFLRLRLRSEQDGKEAFSMFAEDLWNSIASFGWRCSMRCWVYILARNAANRFVSTPSRAARRNLPLSVHAAALARSSSARSATRPYQKTAIKERVRALRARLPLEDQQLLVLHVDRGLPFRELVHVLHESVTPPDDAETDRHAARLRKRYERIKAEIRRLAEAEGLLRPRTT